MNGEAYLSRRAWCLRIALCPHEEAPKRFDQIAFCDGSKITIGHPWTWSQMPVYSLTKWDRLRASMPKWMRAWFHSALEEIPATVYVEYRLLIFRASRPCGARGCNELVDINIAALEDEDPWEAAREFEQDWHNRKVWEAINA